ncbi:MAG: ATP-binding protein, partial [Candidatus Zixiibacteriota bacterium]
LIHNAVDASPKNGRIEITTKLRQELASLTVSDSGQGISDELKYKIYEPFFSTKKSKSSGLGLTIVQSITTRHGGRVGFTANPSEGTTFTVSFPVSAKNLTPTGASEGGEEVKKRILIVDDDQEIRRVLCDMFSLEGIKAECCADAYGAMEHLEKGNYHILITDLGMPGMSGMSGYDLAEYVQDKYKDMEIVLLTGWGETLRKNGKELRNVKAIISKPFRLNQVLELARQ